MGLEKLSVESEVVVDERVPLIFVDIVLLRGGELASEVEVADLDTLLDFAVGDVLFGVVDVAQDIVGRDGVIEAGAFFVQVPAALLSEHL